MCLDDVFLGKVHYKMVKVCEKIRTQRRTCDEKTNGMPGRTPAASGIGITMRSSLLKAVLCSENESLIQRMAGGHRLRTVLPLVKKWRKLQQLKRKRKLNPKTIRIMNCPTLSKEGHMEVIVTEEQNAEPDTEPVRKWSMRELHTDGETALLGPAPIYKIWNHNVEFIQLITDVTIFPGGADMLADWFIMQSKMMFNINNKLWRALICEDKVVVLSTKFMGVKKGDYLGSSKLKLGLGQALALGVEANPIKAVQLFKTAVLFNICTILNGNKFEGFKKGERIMHKKGKFVLIENITNRDTYEKIDFDMLWEHEYTRDAANFVYEHSKNFD